MEVVVEEGVLKVKIVGSFFNSYVPQDQPIDGISVYSFLFKPPKIPLLTEFPMDVMLENANDITAIILDNQEIEEIPDLSFLPNLETLCVSGNKIKKVPDLPRSLIFLNIKGNPLEEFPRNLPEKLELLLISGFSELTSSDNLPESLVCMYLFSPEGPIYPILSFKDLRLPNLKDLTMNLSTPISIQLENCVFSLDLQFQNSPIGNRLKSAVLQHSLETRSKIYASRRTRHLDDHANLIKSRFELWSLREEGARFERAQREYKEFFG